MNETKTPVSPNPKPFYLRPKFITWTIAAIIFLILILQNIERVTIDVFFMSLEAPAALLYLIFSILGFSVGWLIHRTKPAKAISAEKAPKEPK